MLGVSAYCNQRIHYLTSYNDCTFCLLPSVIKTSSTYLHRSLLKHEYTIILYQEVSYACGNLYSVMILLHIDYDGVECYSV